MFIHTVTLNQEYPYPLRTGLSPTRNDWCFSSHGLSLKLEINVSKLSTKGGTFSENINFHIHTWLIILNPHNFSYHLHQMDLSVHIFFITYLLYFWFFLILPRNLCTIFFFYDDMIIDLESLVRCLLNTWTSGEYLVSKNN